MTTRDLKETLTINVDKLSPELRRLEAAVDEFHKFSPLLSLPWPEAAWYLIAQFEEVFFMHRMRILEGAEYSEHDTGALIDHIVMNSKWPLFWAWSTCASGKKIPTKYYEKWYSEARNLWSAGEAYLFFESAFTYGSLGMLSLKAEGNVISVSDDLRSDIRFEAYDRMVAVDIADSIPEPTDTAFRDQLVSSVGISGQQFRYRIDPKLVQLGLETLGPALDFRMRLSPDIALSSYSVGEFHKVAKCLWVLAVMHDLARVQAAVRGCPGGGYAGALPIFESQELARRLTRYTDLSQTTVANIINTMTYGSRGIKNPDPALQPLIPLTADKLTFSPTLITHSALERNHMVLINRLDEEKEFYTAIADSREELTRSDLVERLSRHGLNTWSGHINAWGRHGEVDLVVYSNSEQCALVCELKSFINPAETREVQYRSKEITRGVEQIKARREQHEQDPGILTGILALPENSSVHFAVVSDSSIGASYAQDKIVPVVNAWHLAQKCKELQSLTALCSWLDNRSYLPVENKHFTNVEMPCSIGDIELKWYGLKAIGDLP